MQVEKKRKPRQNTAKPNQIPNFLLKTYKILENDDYKDIISWNEDGTSFRIIKTSEFSEKILPNFFKSNKFESFVRQLNMYDFRKLSRHHDSDANEWKHPNFQRGKPELLQEIKRKIADQTQGKVIDGNSMMQLIQQKDQKDKEFEMIYKEIDKLYNKSEVLEKAIHILIAQNNQILAENKILWQEMAKNNRERERHDKKLEKFLNFFFSFLGNDNQPNLNLRGYDNDIEVEPVNYDKILSKKKGGQLQQLQKIGQAQSSKESEKMLKKLLKGMNAANMKTQGSQFESFIDNYHQNHTDLIKNIQKLMTEPQAQQAAKRIKKSFDLVPTSDIMDEDQADLTGEYLLQNLEKQNLENSLKHNVGAQYFSPNKKQETNNHNMPLMITEKSNSNNNNTSLLFQDLKKPKMQQKQQSNLLQIENKDPEMEDISKLASNKQALKIFEKNMNKKNQQLSDFQEHLKQIQMQQKQEQQQQIQQQKQEQNTQQNFNNGMDNYKMEEYNPVKPVQQDNNKSLDKLQAQQAQPSDFQNLIDQVGSNSPGINNGGINNNGDFDDIGKLQFSLSNRPSNTDNNHNHHHGQEDYNDYQQFMLNNSFNDHDMPNFLQLSRNPSTISNTPAKQEENQQNQSNNNNVQINNVKVEEKEQNKENDSEKKNQDNNNIISSLQQGEKGGKQHSSPKQQLQIIPFQQPPIQQQMVKLENNNQQTKQKQQQQQQQQQQIQQQLQQQQQVQQQNQDKIEEDNLSVNKYLSNFSHDEKMVHSLNNSFF